MKWIASTFVALTVTMGVSPQAHAGSYFFPRFDLTALFADTTAVVMRYLTIHGSAMGITDLGQIKKVSAIFLPGHGASIGIGQTYRGVLVHQGTKKIRMDELGRVLKISGVWQDMSSAPSHVPTLKSEEVVPLVKARSVSLA